MLGVVVAVLVVVGWFTGSINILGFRWWFWHQKLTVEVQTPDGVKSASSVSAVRWERVPEWFHIGDSGGGPGAGFLKGEAVVLQLDEGKYLFALLKGDLARMAIHVFAEPPLKAYNRQAYGPVLDRLPGLAETRILTPKQYPLLVTFRNINDPASVKQVDPADLAATFGPGYSLTSITMSITDEPMTKGKVEDVLGWLENFRAIHLDGSRYATIDADNRFANSLSAGSFVVH